MFDYIDIENPKEVGKCVQNRYDDWRPFFETNYFNEWVYLLQQFFCFQPRSGLDIYRSKVFLPIIYAEIDTALPRFIQALFSTDPPFHADPRASDMGQEVRAEIVENLINRWWKIGQRKKSAAMACQDSMIFGTGYEKARWLLKRQWSNDPKKGGKAILDLPVFEPANVFNIFFDPTASRFSLNGVIHREYKRRSKIEEEHKAGANYDEQSLKDLEPVSPDSYALDEIFWAAGKDAPYAIADNLTLSKNGDDPFVLILEASTDDWIATVDGTNGNLLSLRSNPIHRVPYLAWQYKPIGQMMIGRPLTKTLLPMQEMANNAARALMDNMMQSVHGMHLVARGSGVTKEDLIPSPNKVIEVDDPAGRGLRELVTPLHRQENIQTVSSIQQYQQDIVERASGHSPYFQGTTPPRQETMGGISLMIQEGSKRQWLEIERWADECIAGGAELTYRMAMAFMDEEMVPMALSGRRVPRELVNSNFFQEQLQVMYLGQGPEGQHQIQVGSDFVESLVEDAFQFIPTGSSGLAVREYQQQQVMQLRQHFMNHPFLGPQPAYGLPQNMVALQMLGDMELIEKSEIAGKDQWLRTLRSAYDGYMQQSQIMMQQQAQPQLPPGQEGAMPPEQGQPMPEEGAAPPAPAPEGMMQ